MYELDNVLKVFGDGAAAVHAIDGVSLSINAGEFVVIEGPSGSGKSTLLQLLGALDRPSAGAVMFEGNDLARLPDSKLAELRLRTFGFIFQQFNLVPTLSAAENVEAALAPLGGTRRARRETALRLLDGVGLSDRAAHLPSQLSGGEQQRVAIARALSKGPRVILADEPTGNLDTRTGHEIMGILRRLVDDLGQTVVLITHDADIAAAAPRVVRVRDGRIVADASGPSLAREGQPVAVQPLPQVSDTARHGASEASGPRQSEQAGVGAPAGRAAGATAWVETASVPKNPSEALLHAEGVVKHYVTENEDVIGVDGVSLTVHPGEFVAITGPSGSGKTTLLNCLSGLDRIDHGRVLITGQTVHDLSDKEQSHLRSEVMGFIFQNWNLVPVFSAVENVELPLLLNGVKPGAARAKATETLERIGLGHRLGHHPNTLSGGEQQRVAIARALAAGPALVWADEPTGNLDSHTAESVMQLLRELNADGLAIVLVTHDESIAEQATRRIYLRDGRLTADMTRRDSLAGAKPKPGAVEPPPAEPVAAPSPIAPTPTPELGPAPAPAPAPTPTPAPDAPIALAEDPFNTPIPEWSENPVEVERAPRRHAMTKADRRAARRAARMANTERPTRDDPVAVEPPPPAPPAPARPDPSPRPPRSGSMSNGVPEPVHYDDPF